MKQLLFNHLVINNLVKKSKCLTFQKQNMQFGDCDLCVEFALLLSIFTLERKKNQINKNKTRCLAIILTQM